MKKSEITKKKILDAGVKLWPNVTTREIARQVGITHPVVTYHFGDGLLDAIALHAIQTGKSKVIAQLIAMKHPSTRRLSQSERQMHMDAMV